MRNRLLSLIAAASLLLWGAPASAEGVYLGIHGGSNLTFGSDIDNSDNGLQEIHYDVGFGVGGALGYKWSFGLRTEGEFTYRRNKVDEIEISGSDFEADGNVSSISIMANAFYDFDNSTRWTPYVGGGLGAIRASWNDVDAGPRELDDDQWLFAAQFGGGVSFAITDAFLLSIDYRLLATEEVEIDDDTGDDIELGYLNSTIWLGFRYQF